MQHVLGGTQVGPVCSTRFARTADHDDRDSAACALAAALDRHDRSTGEHSEAVVSLAVTVASALTLPPAEIAAIRHVALLHDIGKIGVSTAILRKRGPLDPEEALTMREHPAIGARIVHAIPALSDLAPAIRAEHERWDGRGYPDGLAGEDIPLASRVVLACDAYHAMSSNRPYRDALDPEITCEELRAGAGTQFDPVVTLMLLAQVAA